jgi:hypothetical protein
VQLFVHGLSPSFKAFVFARHPESFIEAIESARLGNSINAMTPTVNAVMPSE